MASISRHCLHSLLLRRFFSSPAAVLNPTTASDQNHRTALSLLKNEKDPNRILEICRAAALTSNTHNGRFAFSAAVSNLAASNSTLAIRSLLQGLQNDRSRHHAIALFGQAGMLDDALQMFEQTPRSPSVKCFNALLFACILAKKHDQVGKFFREFPRRYRIVPDLNSYNTVIKAMCELGLPRAVFSILEEMGRKRIKPNAISYNILIAGLYKEEKLEDVSKVLELMKKRNCYIGISTWNVMIQSLCKLKKSGEAKELLEKMRSRGMAPNTDTYRHLIHGFCAEGDLEEAKRLFDEMGSAERVPDSECYFTLIYYLCQGGDFEEALKVCKQSMEMNWFPRFSITKALVEGLVSCSRIEEAREVVEAVKERFPNSADIWKETEERLIK